MPEIQVTKGTIEYREEGQGPPVVLIHGALVNGRVWERLVPALSGWARCIVPELPLGSHRIPMDPDADLTPPGIAKLISELLDRLELTDVTLIGSDTGGALSQLVVASYPERIGRLVLANCDAFENFPPASFAGPVKALRSVPGAVAMLGLGAQVKPIRARSSAMMPLTVDPVPDELLKSWVDPLLKHGVRRDLVKLLRGMSPEHTLAAAERLPAFDRPVLIVWGMRDPFFPVSDGKRLAEVLPNARFERIQDARAFIQLDAPDRFADLIAELMSRDASPAPTPA